jgi:AmmeMemoRadiSam system protein B
LAPHAGWICSGAIAGQTIRAIANGRVNGPDVVVVFAAIHTAAASRTAILDTFSHWDIPGDSCEVDTEFRASLLHRDKLFRADDRFHLREHAVEVELPLLHAAWRNAKVLAVEVPPDEWACDIGFETAQVVADLGRDAVFLASSDLTHYGPSYGFSPAGVGMNALAWAKMNDRYLLDLIIGMKAELIVPEVRAHLNACGAGAVAAMLSACRTLGATVAKELCHATSFETLATVAPQTPDNAVGYAAIVAG